MLPRFLTILICFWLPGLLAQDTWEFTPTGDPFSENSLLDISFLNEDIAGQTGWISTNAEGAFVDGAGNPIRFWAAVADVERQKPYPTHHSDVGGYQPEPLLSNLSRWFAKRGVNLVRCHSHINPNDPDTENMTDVNMGEIEWIWRTVGAMKAEGIYTVVSPYWANTMNSNDNRWGTDWNGQHHALLFFEEDLISAYKEWLRVLFTTPTDYLDGRTLAEEPAMAVFQIQNEDSFLFWTINNLNSGQKARLGKQFGDWAIAKYESLDHALAQWGSSFGQDDDLENGILGFANIYEMTAARKEANADNLRLQDQLQFWVETMMAFNREIARFVREDLNCPVLVNAGNWKTSDDVYLNDAERYSYTANEVLAVNRYFNFGKRHQTAGGSSNDGWSINIGERYVNMSVLKDHPLSFPLNLKQATGHPMMITESTWVYPTETAFESPMLVSAYSSLNGIDSFFWFAVGTDDFEKPRSANGWRASQRMWMCMTPEMAGQWPAAALAYRANYIQEGSPSLNEHRSLKSIYARKSPLIAETSTFDPNRDTSDLPSNSPFESGVNPLAYFVGPVHVTYDSNESNSTVQENLDDFLQETDEGVRVQSNTEELLLDTINHTFTIDAPKVQSLVTYEPHSAVLSDVSISTGQGECAVTVISLDGLPLNLSQSILIQVGSRTVRADWETRDLTVETDEGPFPGKEILTTFSNDTNPPWKILNPGVSITLANATIDTVTAVDMYGEPIGAVEFSRTQDGVDFDFPANTMYVIATGHQSYEAWWKSYDPEGRYSSVSAYQADPDRDGRVNLIEYAQGSHPLGSEPGTTIQTGIENQGMEEEAVFHYMRNAQAVDLEYHIETSADLETWTPLVFDGVQASEEIVPASDITNEVTVRIRWGQNEAVKYIRLRVMNASTS